LFAVETIPSGKERRCPINLRKIRSASLFDQERVRAAKHEYEGLLSSSPNIIPANLIPQAGRSDNRVVQYGYKNYMDLFNPRQRLHIALLGSSLTTLNGPEGEAMKIAFSDHLTTNNMLCGYAGGWRRLSPLFAIRAIRHITRAVEINPWLEKNGRGTFPNAVRSVSRAAQALREANEPTLAGKSRNIPSPCSGGWDVRIADARQLVHIPNETIDLVVTDPPYFNYISYSELGHFFVPWLVHFGFIDPSYLNRFPEGQISSFANGKMSRKVFSTNLTEAFCEIVRVCKPKARIVFTYQNLDGRGWGALGRAMADAGLLPFRAFPLFGDAGASLHKHTNSISWDCVLVCKIGKPRRDLEFGEDHRRAGVAFAAKWAKRLNKKQHMLSPGDIMNLQHAATVIATFTSKCARYGRQSEQGKPTLVQSRFTLSDDNVETETSGVSSCEKIAGNNHNLSQPHLFP
jgi:adenine-specific DNA methylase